MRILVLQCDQCSGPLDVPVEREQFSCPWCGSMLHVSQLGGHHPSAPATDARGPSEQELRQQRELEQLDAEWEAYRAEYLPKDEAGEYTIPEPEACRIGAWLTGIVGSLIAAFALFAANWAVAIGTIVAAAALIFVLIRQSRIAPVYERSLENYRASRLKILRS